MLHGSRGGIEQNRPCHRYPRQPFRKFIIRAFRRCASPMDLRIPSSVRGTAIEFQKKIFARPEGEIRVRRTDSTSSRILTDNADQNLFLKLYMSCVCWASNNRPKYQRHNDCTILPSSRCIANHRHKKMSPAYYCRVALYDADTRERQFVLCVP
jgi:hypothetical protein